MADGDLPREPGEDVVKWRNRCLAAKGRDDIRWRYNGRGGTELFHTRTSKGFKDETML